MLTLVMSVGVAFASDNASDVIAVDDEVIADEPLAVQNDDAVSADSDSQVVSANESKVTITPENLNQYIDSAGGIYDNVTATEFEFSGSFYDLNLTIERPLIVTGAENTLFNNPNIEVYSSNVTLRDMIIYQDKGINSIFIGGDEESPISDVTLSDLYVDFEDDGKGPEAIPVHVINTDNFKLLNSMFMYVGHTSGYFINNVIRVTNSRNAVVSSNLISASMPSVPVGWSQEGGEWVSAPMSEGIVFKNSDGVTFEDNTIELTFNNASGAYDTIYVVDFTNCSNATVIGNDINGTGYSYIYGITLSGNDFMIKDNNITTVSDFYANGIDIEGPATGDVVNNTIDVKATTSVYGIYSGMNGQNTTVKYDDNKISGEAYNAFGMSIGDVISTIENTQMLLIGNYTTGIAYRGSELNASKNFIVLISSEVGNESVWEGFGVESRGILVINGTTTISDNLIVTSGKGVILSGNEVKATLNGNFINVVGNTDKDAYALYASELASLIVNNNIVDYQGATNGTGINNAVYIYNTTDARITNNNFTLDLVSSYVPWKEVPVGSGNWVSFPVSEGIVIDSSEAVQFMGNNVNVTYGDVVGEFDTIYAVDVKESDYAYIENNTIDAKGHTYIYGIILSGENFNINSNTITTESDNYYANGIDIEGPATGVVYDNTIDVTGVESAYAIYSGMNGQNVSALYQNNTISGKAYNVFGMSLGDVESNVEDNSIILDGNYTTGIAYRGSNLNATGNYIVLSSTEVGDKEIWEAFGVEAVGIKVLKGFALIEDNIIATPGKGIHIEGNETDAYVFENFINVVGNDDQNAYGIFAIDAASLLFNSNNVDYQGATKGTGINNGVYVNNVTESSFISNNFTLDLVSSYVPWFEIPVGSGNWVSFPISEGIVIEDSDIIFSYNNVNVTYSDVVGEYDTIYAVDVKADGAILSDNVINAKGHTYIYGIIITGDEFFIDSNNITAESDNYYANGIDIEGSATGVVYDNTIDVTGVESAYAIYSGMNGQNVSASYQNNTISGKAYNVFGMSLGDVESNVEDNSIILDGNYTTGIAYRGSNLNATGNYIVLSSTEVGDKEIWEAFGVEAVGIKVLKGFALIEDNIIATPGKGIHIEGNETDGYVFENFINVVGNDDQNAYGIFAIDAVSLLFNSNNVDYQGATKGTGINNAVYVNNVTQSSFISNNFTLDLVSSYVPWFEIPTGSGNWVSFPISEGIVIEDSDIIFSDNNVNVTYGDVVGSYDTIYAVDVKADDAILSNNVINAKGHTYIYGIIISGENFFIDSNNITAESDNYYANGIDIEGPADGSVYNNNIRVNATTSAYGIYSGMNGEDTDVIYDRNYIFGVAYNVFGMSLGDVESTILNSEIIADGNYTTGIAYRGTKITINNTAILAFGSNVGNEDIWEAFGVESVGVKIVNGTSEVTNNRIITTGNYPVDVRNTSASVHDNNLIGLKYMGDEGVANAENAEVYNNTPKIGNKTAVVITITEVNGNCEVSGILKEINGTPVSLYELSYTFDGVTKPVKTDENGTFKVTGISNGKVDIFLEEDSHYLASDVVSITLTDIAPVKEPTTANVTIGDLEIGKDANVTVDIPGATGNVSVIVDGVETIAALDENGNAVVTIENITGGEHSIVVIYTGDETHAAAYKIENIFLEQFDTRFDNLTVEGSGFIDGVLVNALGDPIANATIVYIANGVESNVTTDEYGWFIFNVTLDADLTISYAGTDVFLPTELSIKLQNMAPTRTATVFDSKDFTQYACDYYEGERGGDFTFRLLDEMGNPLANKTVFIGYNGVTYNRTTDENGYAALQINLKNAGIYTFVLVFLGDKDYNASMAVHKITINKKPITISAAAKTYKATAKTKKYTVTLKTTKGSSADGKTYLAKGKKVTLKLNGVTYTAKTNAKGQATFSLKITKKGKFTTAIKFAGDNTYNAASKSVKITIK